MVLVVVFISSRFVQRQRVIWIVWLVAKDEWRWVDGEWWWEEEDAH